MSKERLSKLLPSLAAATGSLAVRLYYRRKIQEEAQRTKEDLDIANTRARMAEEKAAEYWQAAAKAKEAELKATAESRVDPLTKLVNRRGFDAEYDKLMAYTGRHGGHHSFIALDLDKLKETNDSFGHIAGDELICQAAEILRDNARTEDTAVRLGGDEMGILLPNTPEPAAAVLAERLLSAYGEQGICASFGVTELSPHRSYDENMALADRAMYQGKENGGGQVVLASSLAIQQS